MSRSINIGLIVVLFLTALSCAEEAPAYKSNTVRLYSDFLTEKDHILFRQFEREQRLNVELHYLTMDSLKTLLKVKKWNCGVDLVLLSSNAYMEELKEEKLLYKAKNFDRHWFPLTADPYIFLNESKDSLYLNRSYGQIISSENVFMNLDLLTTDGTRKPLFSGIKKLYPRYSLKEVEAKIVTKDSVLQQDQRVVRLALNSDFLFDEEHLKNLPGQFYRGAIAKTNGVGILTYAFNTDNAIKLVKYCKQEKWRSWVATQWNQYPVGKEFANSKPSIYPIFK